MTKARNIKGNTKFAVGSVVKLASGGPSMTVTSLNYSTPKERLCGEQSYNCRWFVEGELRDASFPEKAIEADAFAELGRLSQDGPHA